MKYFVAVLVLLVTTLAHANKTEEVTFFSHKTKLAGTVVFPKQGELKAAAIFVHGSGKQTRSMTLAKLLAEKGVATLVYDKRGVGESEGKYEGKNPVSEQNLSLLADDAVAAFTFLAAHPDVKNVPIGMTGLSQAGWIVPLAAVKAPETDFIVLWSGPVTKVSEEDILSKYTKDKDSKKVPSFAEALAARKSPYVWPDFLGKDTDPSESLKQLKIPGLWIFGEQDGSIPVDLSITNLKDLHHQGHKFEYVLFSNAGHMNIKKSLSMAVDWMVAIEK